MPATFGHPHFINLAGGAWPLSDYVEEECQAIVRLFRAILRQLGVPTAQASIVVIWADPLKFGEFGEKALEAPWESRDPGLRSWRIMDGEFQFAGLLDEKVHKGQKWFLADENAPGINKYEACLLLKARKKTRYYGGGADIYDSKEEVLTTFSALVWGKYGFDPDEGTFFIVRELVETSWLKDDDEEDAE